MKKVIATLRLGERDCKYVYIFYHTSSTQVIKKSYVWIEETANIETRTGTGIF